MTSAYERYEREISAEERVSERGKREGIKKIIE
jgi:hypothetical protein